MNYEPLVSAMKLSLIFYSRYTSSLQLDLPSIHRLAIRGSFKSSRNHFIFEKYKTVQSFKLHFLQENPLVQLYVSASNCNGVGNIPASRPVKFFLAFLLHS